jgi:hypothetical protein
MAENRLRTLLREGKPSFGTRLQSSWPTLAHLARTARWACAAFYRDQGAALREVVNHA